MKHFLITLVFLTTALFPTSAFADHCTEAGQIHNPENPAFCYTPIPGVSPGTPSTPATYTLMAPLFGEIGPGSSPSLTTYLQGAVQVIIGLAGILAVIMVVVCGIKLMGTPSASGKSEAKECIWNAIFGVLLAIGAWIILYTINPNLLTTDTRSRRGGIFRCKKAVSKNINMQGLQVRGKKLATKSPQKRLVP